MKYTTEQQQEIAQYALDHERDFKATGKKYDISYQQVAAWVRKYDPENQATQKSTKKQSKSTKTNKETISKADTKPANDSKGTDDESDSTSTLDILSRRDPVLEKQLEDVKRRLGLIK